MKTGEVVIKRRDPSLTSKCGKLYYLYHVRRFSVRCFSVSVFVSAFPAHLFFFDHIACRKAHFGYIYLSILPYPHILVPNPNEAYTQQALSIALQHSPFSSSVRNKYPRNICKESLFKAVFHQKCHTKNP